jgi:hypothetical protein
VAGSMAPDFFASEQVRKARALGNLFTLNFTSET